MATEEIQQIAEYVIRGGQANHEWRAVELAEAVVRLRQELVECRDRLEHAERKLAGEWPYGTASEEIPIPNCSRCGRPWQDHYDPEMLRYKNGPHGTFGLIADHTPHIVGVHAPRKEIAG